MPNWQDPKVLERLLAAVIASYDDKKVSVDNMQVARYFNDSFDAVENRTRVYKKQAKDLIQDAQDTGRINQDMRKKKTTPRKPRAERSAGDLNAVSTGRVTKKRSPIKRSATIVKQEEVFDSNSSSDFGDIPSSSKRETTFSFEDLHFDPEAAEYDWGNGIA